MADSGLRRNTKTGGWFNVNDYINKAIRKSYIDKNTFIRTMRDDTFENIDKRSKFIVDRKTGITVGELNYVINNGEPTVQMIHVLPDYRRKGYGTKLMKSLQKDYKGKIINFETLTPEYGEPFIKSIAEITEIKTSKYGINHYKGKIKE